jgi:O-antigen/teichoic acid export membrane protein
VTASYRQILRSTTIIGGASAINIVMSLLRMKAAALLLGPAGVGLIGVFSNLVGVAISFGGMGLANSGTRQIAEAVGRNDKQSIAASRAALLLCSLFLAALCGALFWLLRGVIAEHILNDPARVTQVGWLALAVGLHILAGFQGGVLNGLRRIGDLSKLSVYSAFFSSVIGIGALWMWGNAGIVAYVVSVPLITALIGQWYVSKLPKLEISALDRTAVTEQGRTMIKLGAAFMLVSSIGYSGQLLVRSLIQAELGLDSLGYFQAASAISLTYIGFLVTAMGQDYYPRLTAVITDKHTSSRMVNEQIEVSLLLAGPIFLAMMAMAPWVISLLYSAQFHPAAEVLHWQIIGDVLKVAGWPIGYILVASGDGRAFVRNELVYFCSFGLLTWLFLPKFGIAGSGISFLGMNIVMFCLVFWQAKRRIGFALQPAVIKQLGFLLISSIGLLLLASYSLTATAGAGVLLSASFALYGFTRLAHKSDLTGIFGKVALWAQAWMKRFGVWHD